MVGLAGCIDGVQEHFLGSVQGVIPIEIHSEADRAYKVHLEARERESERNSYQQSFSVAPNEVVQPQHLDRAEQSFQVIRFTQDDEQMDVETVSITPSVGLVVIRITDDDLSIELQQDDDNDNVSNGENETDGNDTNETGESDDTDDE